MIVFLLGLRGKKNFRDFLNNPGEIALSSAWRRFGTGPFGSGSILGKMKFNVRRSAQVVKGEDCKSFMQRFESALRLQTLYLLVSSSLGIVLGMTSLNFRPYSSDDIQIRIDSWNLGWPGYPTTREEIEASDATTPENIVLNRFVSDSHASGPILASAVQTYWYKEPGQFQIAPAMNPETGPYLETYQFLLDHIAQFDPKWVVSPSRTDLPRRTEALIELGFTELERSPVSRIMVDEFDFLDAVEARLIVENQGFRLVSFEELEAEGFDWRPGLFEATNEMAMDIPTENPFEPFDRDEEYKEFANRDAYNPKLMHAVMDGEIFAAYTRIRQFKADPTRAFTEFSGTKREYRRRGLVKAVKAVSIHNAKDHGIKEILTDNLEKNAMYKINLDLGFEVWTHLQLFKRAY